MDHDALLRKLASLDEQIRIAQSESQQGGAVLSKIGLSLEDAIRVAANIRKRLAGVARPADKQASSAAKRPTRTFAMD